MGSVSPAVPPAGSALLSPSLPAPSPSRYGLVQPEEVAETAAGEQLPGLPGRGQRPQLAS
ncbi:hypothetical protein GTW66_20290 [Streptomyces sp. SID5473]|uniref:hypothetical protein n=1 Tax=Streptomyces sp. SID5473 TaxID=2690299 RepID=UPI00131B320B|nr:hypothetical protein [Streptomyces sp. SID5473]MYS66282.1 hypothetical protein [Streptomyces sp. SID5473]